MFKRKIVNTYYYLRLYLNISKNDYGNDKKELIDIFISTTNELLSNYKLKYDIGGSGYGISKGDTLIGIKSLKNKLEKKGFDNLYTLSCYTHKDDIQCQIFFQFKRNPKFSRVSYIVPVNGIDRNKFVEMVIPKFKGSSVINYGYGFSVGKGFLPSSENYLKKSLFSVSSKTNGILYAFEDKVEECLKGKVKDLYEINIWNKKQTERLTSFGISGTQTICDLDYLILGKEEISGLKSVAKTVII
ncbi:MAG: hypothetical protein AAFU57_16730 [Bacteroidota bacterium]